jgi:translation initiation factor 1A
MPGKGGKAIGRTQRKGGHEGKRECPFATEGQTYGKITKLLGSCRMMVSCADGVERMGHVRGALHKRVWVGVGDIVLVSLRSFQDKKGDILYKYSYDELSLLRRKMEIPEGMLASKKSEAHEGTKDPVETGFMFTDDLDNKDMKIDDI